MTVAPTGWRLLVHEQLASTSDLVRTLAEAGEPDGLAVLARRQTAGRGTHGRTWESPPGNLYLTVLLRPTVPAHEASQWGLLAALALHDVLARHVSAPARLTVKWPNDLLLGGAKCAGILTEAAVGPRGDLDWLAIGFGANLAAAPEVPGRATAALPRPAPVPEEAARDLLAALDRWRRIRLLEGFAPIRRAWLERGPAPGVRLSITASGGPVAGLFEGLDESGALLLRSGGRVHAFTSGELDP
ncbi:biotin--[acetyl-CoA-carboxylase] ligase [Muricoccus radiodurans]|uniref:biotin--[acetyl-CoA-carboxylase] ligase n=1 Tax=Muricoccus radiodurans TaxID=2231721 RepID=UPI003CEDC7D9